MEQAAILTVIGVVVDAASLLTLFVAVPGEPKISGNHDQQVALVQRSRVHDKYRTSLVIGQLGSTQLPANEAVVYGAKSPAKGIAYTAGATNALCAMNLGQFIHHT